MPRDKTLTFMKRVGRYYIIEPNTLNGFEIEKDSEEYKAMVTIVKLFSNDPLGGIRW